MNLSIPVAGMQSAGASFDAAASAITRAFDKSSAPGAASASGGDSVDLSSQVAGLLKSKVDFMASVSLAVVENEMQKSTFSMLA